MELSKNKFKDPTIFSEPKLYKDWRGAWNIEFYCNPDNGNGWMYDDHHYKTYDVLDCLFGEFHISTGNSEGQHSIPLTFEEDFNKLNSIIKDRLIKAGAIQWKHDKECQE